MAAWKKLKAYLIISVQIFPHAVRNEQKFLGETE